MWRGSVYRDTWLSGFNHKAVKATIVIRVNPDRQPEKTIVMEVGPRQRWAVNLAGPEHGIVRPGENINIGGSVQTDGTVPFIALWNRPDYGAGAMDDSDPLPWTCQ